MEEVAEAAMAVSLPDDILLEILVRLKDDDAAALFRCATTCKGWCHLVVDPSFLRRCWPEDADHSSFSLIGFLTKDHRKGKGWVVLPAPRSALGRGWRSLQSFLPAVPAGLLDGARLLVSHHGLLLLSLAVNSDDKVLHLAVCNLLLGTCDVLPPPDVAVAFEHDNIYAVLTAADCFSNETPSGNSSTFFKVLVLSCTDDDDDELKFSVHTFSSEKTTWSVSTACFDIILHVDGIYLMSRDAIVHCGTIQWIFCNWGDLCFYLLNVNAQTDHISLTKLSFVMNPQQINYPWLHRTVGGTIALLRMQEKGSKLEIWGQQTDNQNVVTTTSEWICTRIVELKQSAMEETEETTKLHIMGGKGRTLFVTDSQKRVYTADLETGTMEEVVEWPRMSYLVPGESVPLEMDWPRIFLSQI